MTKVLLASKTVWVLIFQIIVFVLGSPAFLNAFPAAAAYTGVIIAIIGILARALGVDISGLVRSPTGL